jgi:gliding motility-associated-like protein
LTLGYYVDSAAALELGNPSFVNSAGTYYIKATNANGCSIVKPVQARIDLPPIIAVNSPIRICANTTSYTLNSSDIRVVDYDTLAWTYDGFGQLTISDPLRPTYTPNTADISRGKVTLTLTARFCNLESTRSIDIEFIAMPTVDIGPDVTICENSVSYVIPDTGGTTGYSTLAWTSTGSAGTLNDMTILTPTYTPSPSDISDGEIVFTLKVNSGVPCNTILTDTKKITIQRLPVITTVSSAQICETENVYDISGTTITNSYDVNSVGWTSSGTYNSFLLQFLDPISQTLQTVVPLDNNYFNICNLNAGLYYLTARDTFNCSSSPYPFTIYDFGNLNIDSVDLDTSLCSGTSGKVRVTVSSLDPNLTFYYNNEIVPNTIVGDNVYELAISNPTFPNGIIKVINQQNCWDSETVSTILPSPTQLNFSSVNLTAYGVISVNESVKFTNGLIPSNIPAEYDYLVWDFGDNTPYNVFYNPKDVNPNTNGESLTTVFHSFAKDGLYPVTLTVFNKFGCSKSITEIITVGQGASIMAPTAFSPNNDGINDLFRPSLLGLKEVNVNIYDNWGNLIYEITSDTASLPTDWGWNGLENGKSEPVNGTYRYYIMAKTINDLIIEKEGQFILIK